jgi:hypothetical protein
MENGIITSVQYEQGVVLCDVQPIRVNNEYSKIPVMKEFDGFHAMPQIGQKVGMIELSDGQRFITKVIARNEDGDYPDSMKQGEVVIQLDDQTKLAFRKNSNDDYDVTLEASGHLQLTGDTVDISDRQ